MLSDRCSAWKTAQNERLQLFKDGELLLLSNVTRNVDLLQKEEEIAQAQNEAAKTVNVSQKLKMAWWRTFAEVSVFHFKEKNYTESEIMVEEPTSLQKKRPDVHGSLLDIALKHSLSFEIMLQSSCPVISLAKIQKEGLEACGESYYVDCWTTCVGSYYCTLLGVKGKAWRTLLESVRQYIPKTGCDCDESINL